MDKQRYSFKMGIDMKGTQKMGNLTARRSISSKIGTVYEGDFYCGSMWGKCHISFPIGG